MDIHFSKLSRFSDYSVAYIPDELEDGFNTPSMEYYPEQYFLDFSKHCMEKEYIRPLDILNQCLKHKENLFDKSNYYGSPISEIYDLILPDIIENMSDSDMLSAIRSIIEIEADDNDSLLFDKILSQCSKEQFMILCDELLAKDSVMEINYTIGKHITTTLQKSADTYLTFRSRFKKNPAFKMIKRFISASSSSPAFPALPEDFKKDILEQEEPQTTQKHLNAASDNSDNTSFHILFDKEKMIEQLNDLLDEIGEGVSDDSYIRRTEDFELRNCNKVIEDIILHTDSDKRTRSHLFKTISNIAQAPAFNTIRYLSGRNLSCTDLNDSEKESIYNWAVDVIENYPLPTVDSTIKYGHIYLAWLLKQEEFKAQLHDLMHEHRNDFKGFLPLDPAGRINGEIISGENISYLEYYFGISFMIDTLVKAISTWASQDFNQQIELYIYTSLQYLTSRITDMKPYQKMQCIRAIEKLINKRLETFIWFDTLKFLKLSHYTLMDMDPSLPDIILDSYIHAAKTENTFLHTCMRSYEDMLSTDDKNYLLPYLHKGFLLTYDLKTRKELCKTVLQWNHGYSDEAIWFFDYLISDGATIPSEIRTLNGVNALCSNSMNVLPIVMKLYRISRHPEDDKQRILRDIALTSLRETALISTENYNHVKKLIREELEEEKDATLEIEIENITISHIKELAKARMHSFVLSENTKKDD